MLNRTAMIATMLGNGCSININTLKKMSRSTLEKKYQAMGLPLSVNIPDPVEIPEHLPFVDNVVKRGRGAPKGFRSALNAFLFELIQEGINTRKQIMEKALSMFPEYSEASMTVLLSNCRNDIRNPFKSIGKSVVLTGKGGNAVWSFA